MPGATAEVKKMGVHNSSCSEGNKVTQEPITFDSKDIEHLSLSLSSVLTVAGPRSAIGRAPDS